MISEIQNYIRTIDENKCSWFSELIEYIKDNFPDAQEHFINKMPAYQTDDSLIAFACEKDVFSFFSDNYNSLDILKRLLPDAQISESTVSVSSRRDYLLHAVKVAVSQAFSSSKVTYTNIVKARFLSRPNRFIANIDIDGQHHICHVKNTGRCRELLKPGAAIYVQRHNNPKRKTDYSLISVLKGNRLINMDSQVPNKAIHKWLLQNNLFGEIEYIKPEYKYHNSRIDFFIKTKNKKILLEVKGVTLEKEGVAMFPDAPTLRGINHINELINAKNEGYESYIVFVIQMESVKYFTPNYDTHPEFGEALKKAKLRGVNVLAYDCKITSDSISVNKSCPVIL